MLPSKLEMHARVRSSAFGRLGSAKTLKLAYKYHPFLLLTDEDASGAPFMVVFEFFFIFGALNSNSIVSLRFFMISMDIFMSFVVMRG